MKVPWNPGTNGLIFPQESPGLVTYSTAPPLSVAPAKNHLSLPNARPVLVKVDLVEADVGATKLAAPPGRSLEPRRSAVLISGLATGPPAGVGGALGPFLVA